MCAIFGSFNKDKFVELMELNSYRGSFSYSYTVIHNDFTSKTFKDFGTMDKNMLSGKSQNGYMLGHVQAPTGGLIKNYSRIHPAEKNEYLLWHNGIIKGKYLTKMQEELNSTNEWDTKLLLDTIVPDAFMPTTLNDVDGAFSCVLMKQDAYLMLFRNSTSPLFMNDALDISSTKFQYSSKTDKNVVYNVDFVNRKMTEFTKFQNINNPYYFAGEQKENV
jgi:glucosamine 6-phosphate synthetase-like amidotransferase/phosphosugar isomerase protein